MSSDKMNAVAVKNQDARFWTQYLKEVNAVRETGVTNVLRRSHWPTFEHVLKLRPNGGCRGGASGEGRVIHGT